ncbi:MAG: glutamine-hydrolyzing GMP synthase, partial [Candidatus Omnitrophota bacterium]|nr:glutamine-hydrolyzing GMP synthase [Candidatus Omnitrophota bacterium]
MAILDFGSQYTHLIARRVRECGIYSEIVAYNISASRLIERLPKAIILSGGPASVIKKGPVCDKGVFNIGIPILGICYGAQLMAKNLGGRVAKAKAREYGKAILKIKSKKNIFKGLLEKEMVWMSHGDKITKLPCGFRIIGSTDNAYVAAMEDNARRFYGFQFHPEVVHTPKGRKVLKNFLYYIANCSSSWSMHSFVKDSIKELREKIGKEKVLCALSGGVDSSVLTMLLHKAIGKNLIAIFINNGLLRKGEERLVQQRFKSHYHINLKTVDAKDIFLKALRNVKDPEKKRRIIGKVFIEVFQRQAKRLGRIKFLAQGTLYPDVIESRSAFGGPSAIIKTHHNVGGLPPNLGFELIEPLKSLFKDEVREVGKELGLPDVLIY